ncbi:MAG TPA: hypothetical protein VLY23_16260 [Candidatus Acidoferrum sp.]|nr:hypothetical protein [Candidatus Acidoferrum sp.]
MKTPVRPAAPSFWHRYKEGLVIPAAYLLRDATITIIAIAANALILLASKGFEAIGAPIWFTSNLEKIDLAFALINASLLAFDTTAKLFVTAVKGFKE